MSDKSKRGQPSATQGRVPNYVWPHVLVVFPVGAILCLVSLIMAWLLPPIQRELVIAGCVVLSVIMGLWVSSSLTRHVARKSLGYVAKMTFGSILLCAMCSMPVVITFLIFSDVDAFISSYDGSWRKGQIAGMYFILMPICLAPLFFLWFVTCSVSVYIPGHLTRSGEHSEEDMKWMARESSYSTLQRLELARHLATQSPDSVSFALAFNLYERERIELATRHLIEELSSEEIYEVLDRSVPFMPPESLDTLMKTWCAHESKLHIFMGLARQSVLQTHMQWAPMLLEAAHEADISGAQMPAVTTLRTARLSMHAMALEYLSKFGRPPHIPHLYEVQRAFSLHPGLGAKIDHVIAMIEATYGGSRGGLSLSEEDETRGAISHVQGSHASNDEG